MITHLWTRNDNMNEIYSMQTYNIQITAGNGGQVQVFQNGANLGYFRGTQVFPVSNGDNISVWCDADSGYTYTNLCIDGTTTCTTARPFNFTANMNIAMTATFTLTQTCNQQDNTLLINGKSGTVTVAPGDTVTASVRYTSANGACAGVYPEWRIIAVGTSPLGTGDIRVDTTTNTFDSNGCGSTNVTFSVVGTYTLAARYCCSWSGDSHCLLADTDLSNTITLVVKSSSGGGGTQGCDPSVCNSVSNYCILNQCIPKNYVILAAIGAFALMLLQGGEK